MNSLSDDFQAENQCGAINEIISGPSMKFTPRQYIGAMLYDLPRYLFVLSASLWGSEKKRWVTLKNRHEDLLYSPDNPSVYCNWQWTSDLYLPKVFPVFGRWLYRRAFADFSVRLQREPAGSAVHDPDVSFIIGHRGVERLPLLLTTLQSIAGQRDCRFECIVVEQDTIPGVQDKLPGWIRYIHTPLPDKNMAYSRSWAFNVGAGAARSEFLILHDNDMLVPEVYARELFTCFQKGYEFINLKRFIFYLDQRSSEKIVKTKKSIERPAIDRIMQNAEGGGSIGASRQAYFAVGGFDERFVGWGGEDNEFWERAGTGRVYPYGYLPLIHLWHGLQPEKMHRSEAGGVSLYHRLRDIPVEERIKNLRAGR